MRSNDVRQCKACDVDLDTRKGSPDSYVCAECYRNPNTNYCLKCGRHLVGIPYEYVCGICISNASSNKEGNGGKTQPK